MSLTDPAEAALETDVVSVDDLASDVFEAGWRVAALARHPRSVRLQAADGRWSTRLVAASTGGRLIGLMPLQQSRSAAFPVAIFDPAAVAPELVPEGKEANAARQFLFVGGVTELVASGAVADDVDPVASRAALTAMAETGFARAAAEGLTGLALYVRDGERPCFSGAGEDSRRRVVVDEFSVLSVPGSGGYPGSLNHSRRSVVRRDWRRLDELSLRADEVHVQDVIGEASDLIVDVKRRHGVADYARLTQLRLARWADGAPGERIAFAVRDRQRRLLAVSFGNRFQEVLEMYEIGLRDTDPHRHLSYVEALVYAPLRYAERVGCTHIHLGLGSSRPKMLRGAELSPVWAIG